MRFSRRTVIAAVSIIENWTHAEIDRLLLEYELENEIISGSKMDRANSLIRYLLNNPQVEMRNGRNLGDALVQYLAQYAMNQSMRFDAWDAELMRQRFPRLIHALEQDGYVVDQGVLRRALPEALELPQVDDEVHDVLRQRGFNAPLGHLDQAIEAHSRGNWAAANGQLRTYVEGLFDELAQRLAPNPAEAPSTADARRRLLADLRPPLLRRDLNEWEDDGKGFIQGFIRRLHPQGPHPGLSDEDDSTFRLHLVLLVTAQVLRRYCARVSGT